MPRLHAPASAPARTFPAGALVLCAALAAPTIGCGGGDDDFDAPTCAAGEVALEGTIDGGHESASLSGPTGYIFVNALNGELGTLTVTFGTADRLHLEWPDLVSNGDSVDVRGTIAFPGLDLGNCEDDGYPGTLRMDPEGDGGTFRLHSLRPGADCTAAEVSGELTGCFASSSS